MDNINTWTELSVEESIRMTEDSDEWRNCVHGVANPHIEDGYRTEQNSARILSILMEPEVSEPGEVQEPGRLTFALVIALPTL